MPYPEFLSEFGDRYLDGIQVTAVQFLMATALAVLISLIMGLGKLSPSPVLRWSATAYIEFFRGTSLLVQLFWLFYVLPLFGLTLDKYVTGFIAVGLNLGAYGAELVRGGIQSVPTGQWEAAYSLSMSSARRMWRIILPQAFLNMLPPWGNLIIELLKYTALVALIAVPDVMFEARQINGSTFLSAQAFGTALIIYYVLARFLVTPFMRSLERIMMRKMGKA